MTEAPLNLVSPDGQVRMRDYLPAELAPTPRQYRLSVIGAVANRRGIPVRAIMGRDRTPLVSAARQEAMAEIRARFGDSLPRIGKLFGRDHTTVLAGIRKHHRSKAAL